MDSCLYQQVGEFRADALDAQQVRAVDESRINFPSIPLSDCSSARPLGVAPFFSRMLIEFTLAFLSFAYGEAEFP